MSEAIAEQESSANSAGDFLTSWHRQLCNHRLKGELVAASVSLLSG